MSLRTSAHTGVAIRSLKAPLADQGELSRASPASTRLRGSELPSFCVLSLPQFDNPSVKNQRFLPAAHCGMTATGSHGNFDSLRGAPPFTQGSRGCSRTSAFFGNRMPRSQSVPQSLPLWGRCPPQRADEGNLPLPMGEVPEAERAIFTLSVTS